eukprot:g44534.t1
MGEQTVHGWFQATARKVPGKVALEYHDEKSISSGEKDWRCQVTYSELDHLSDLLAEHTRLAAASWMPPTPSPPEPSLTASPAEPEPAITQPVVAVLLENGVERYVAYLACLKAHAVYCPLEVSWPSSLLLSVLSTSSPSLLLTVSSVYSRALPVSPSAAAAAVSPPAHTALPLPHGPAQRVSVLLLDRWLLPPCAGPQLARGQAAQQTTHLNQDHSRLLAHLIFTSGTSAADDQADASGQASPAGRPKAVLCDHVGSVLSHAARARLLALETEPGGEAEEWRVGCNVFGIWDGVLALLHGHTAVLLADAVMTNPPALAHVLTQRSVTHLMLTPSLLELCLACSSARAALFGLRHITLCGERLSAALAKRFFALQQQQQQAVTEINTTTTTTTITIKATTLTATSSTTTLPQPAATASTASVSSPSRKRKRGAVGQAALSGGARAGSAGSEGIVRGACELHNLYSLSECHDVAMGRVLHAQIEQMLPEQVVGCGPVLPFARVCVLAAGRRVLVARNSTGRPGRLAIGGAGLAKGYVGAALSARARFINLHAERWFVPGDRGLLAAEGSLTVLGREAGLSGELGRAGRKNRKWPRATAAHVPIKVRGQLVSLPAVRQALACCPGVLQCAVLPLARVFALPGRAGALQLTELLAVVVLDPDHHSIVPDQNNIVQSTVSSATRHTAQSTASAAAMSTAGTTSTTFTASRAIASRTTAEEVREGATPIAQAQAAARLASTRQASASDARQPPRTAEQRAATAREGQRTSPLSKHDRHERLLEEPPAAGEEKEELDEEEEELGERDAFCLPAVSSRWDSTAAALSCPQPLPAAPPSPSSSSSSSSTTTTTTTTPPSFLSLVPLPAPARCSLRSLLARSLPAYAVPSRFLALSPALPTSAVSGKFDAKALHRAVQTAVERIADRPTITTTTITTTTTSTTTTTTTTTSWSGGQWQHRLAHLFAELLGTPPPSPTESFFELGGHSLLALVLLDATAQLVAQAS